jgi:hypothetical protein
MSSHEISPPEELVRLTRLAHEAQGLSVLVHAQYQLRSAIRRALLLQQWSELESVQHELAASSSLAARFSENLHHVLETLELSAGEPFGRLHGLVLATRRDHLQRPGRRLAAASGIEFARPVNASWQCRDAPHQPPVPRRGPRHGARALCGDQELAREGISGVCPATAPGRRPQPVSTIVCFSATPHHEDSPSTGPSNRSWLVKWSAAHTEAIL